MGKILKQAEPMEFRHVRETARSIGENNDCSVLALALLADVPYQEAHKAMADAGRKFKKGTPLSVTYRVYKAMGLKLTTLTKTEFISQYPGVHKNLKCITSHHPNRFPGVFKQGKKYLCHTGTHAFAIIDGKTMDWSVAKALRVQIIYEVTKAEEA